LNRRKQRELRGCGGWLWGLAGFRGELAFTRRTIDTQREPKLHISGPNRRNLKTVFEQKEAKGAKGIRVGLGDEPGVLLETSVDARNGLLNRNFD
jgi:hypothetical protein